MLEISSTGTTPGEAVFRVEKLQKTFMMRTSKGLRALRAVDDINFTLSRGETLAVVGQSGSGKSTLARSLLRLVEPTSGAVYFRGENLVALSPRDMRAARRHVQMIFQDPYASLHPRRTVGEIISDPWKIHKGMEQARDYRARVAELLQQVGPSPAYAAAFPTRLSGGERQRIAIARALAMRPEVQILDEPVSALDMSIRAQVIKLLMRLQQELGIAYIFISHDLPLVRLVADRVAVMEAVAAARLRQAIALCAQGRFARWRNPARRLGTQGGLDQFSGIGWPDKWKQLTGLDLITRLPYSGGPLAMDNLASYLRGLDIEQALADHHALFQLRLHSPSCTGILYWPLNKGGPLFQFGCVDFLGYPLASFYVVKRVFADVAIGLYRDVDDIRVIGSNLGGADVAGQLVIQHVRADGTVLDRITRDVTLTTGDPQRLADLAGFYGKVIERTREVINARLLVDARVVAEETMFLCPLIDFEVTPDTMTVNVKRLDATTAHVEITARSVVKTVIIDGNQKWLADDNYFALLPGETRSITVRRLEQTSGEPPRITVTAMNTTELHDHAL